jgi:hypothetical protein
MSEPTYALEPAGLGYTITATDTDGNPLPVTVETVSVRSIVFDAVDNPTAPAAPYASWEEAAQDPLARPLTFPQVVKRTGRSRRTISSWIHEGVLTPYRLADGTRMVRVFLERQVLEVDRAKRDAAAASRLNLAQRRLTAHRADNPPHLE